MAKQLYPITGSCVRGVCSQGLRALAFFRLASSGRYRALLAARKSDSIGSIAHYSSKHLSVKWVVAQLKARPRDGHGEEQEPTIINDSSRYPDNRYLRITGELASSSLPYTSLPLLPPSSSFSYTSASDERR